NDGDAARNDRTVRVRVERPAVAVRGSDSPLGAQVTAVGVCQRDDGDAPGEGHVALTPEQALARQVDRPERGRARRLYRDRRPSRSELEGYARGQVIRSVQSVGAVGLVLALSSAERIQDGPEPVQRRARAPEHADPTLESGGIAPRVLERIVCALEEEPLL